MTWTKSN